MARLSFNALVGATGFALLAPAIGHVRQAQAAPPLAKTAVSPALKQLKDLLKVLNNGDEAAIKAYARVHTLDLTPEPASGELPLVGALLDLKRRTHGVDLVRVGTVQGDGVVAVVRSRLTGDEQVLSIKIEPQSPHRITGIPTVPSVVATTLVRPGPVASSERARLQQISSYLKKLGGADIFSGVVVIARGGQPVFSQAYGYADREKKIANTLTTPFLLGSMNKFFTGLAIGQLVEKGKLSYDDPLSKFVPDFPDAESAKRIKIKHLLSHTSGLGSYFNPNFFKSLDKLRNVQDTLDVAGREPPKFEPGTKWAYSNTGFQLLGRVIEVVTGTDYYDYMRENVFAPVGVTGITFPQYDRDAVAMAQPYEIDFDGDHLKYENVIAITPRRGGPAGGGLASAADLIKFSNALYGGRVVKLETLRLHARPKPDLASPNYGYGFSTQARMAKRPLVGHGGNAPGMCTEYGVLTDTPYTIVILSNATFDTCISVTRKILEVLAPLPDAASASQTAPPHDPVDAKVRD